MADNGKIKKSHGVTVKQKVEYVVISYRDGHYNRKYVDPMPLHWIEDKTLWFPPEGKSESQTQVINYKTWRQYAIRHVYWDTKTHDKKKARSCADELRKKEEMDAADTTTDSDNPLVSRQQNVGKSIRNDSSAVPPSAPNVNGLARQKPPPSETLLQLRNKRPSSSPKTSDDEENDPTWSSHQPQKKLLLLDPCNGPPTQSQMPVCSTASNEIVGDYQPSQMTAQMELLTTTTAMQEVSNIGSLLTASDASMSSLATKATPLLSPQAPTTLVVQMTEESTDRNGMRAAHTSLSLNTPPITVHATVSANMTTLTQLVSTVTTPRTAVTGTSNGILKTPRTTKSPNLICQQQTTQPECQDGVSVIGAESNNRMADSTERAEVLNHLRNIYQLLERHTTNVSQKFVDIQQRLTAVENILQERFSSELTADTGVAAPAVVGQPLTTQYRSLLQRCPVVSNDEQWIELEIALQESGKIGRFFASFVQTIKGCILNKSDVHKTANATLRAIFAESYLADRVTMAGYRKDGNKTSRDYGSNRPFIKIGRGIVYAAIFEVIKVSCASSTNDSTIQKAIREGLNTIRLHHKEVTLRENRKQQLNNSETFEVDFIESSRDADSNDD